MSRRYISLAQQWATESARTASSFQESADRLHEALARLRELEGRPERKEPTVFGMTGVPDDYLEPRWDEARKCHCWRNHVSDELEAIWDTFTPHQKAVLARDAESEAHNEEWE